MKFYTFTLEHDTGKINITTAASNLAEAIRLIETAENCPESAILKIRIKEFSKVLK